MGCDKNSPTLVRVGMELPREKGLRLDVVFQVVS